MDDSKNDKQKELDRFWDISALIPQKRYTPPPTRSTDAVEITVEPRVASQKRETDADLSLTKAPDQRGTLVRKFIPPYTAEEFAAEPKPDDEYEPERSLIHRVKIFNWKTSYNYYEQFLNHARKIKNAEGVECPQVSFFSYVPQFSQLSRPQLNWYLWWRRCAINGQHIKTDYSYILLFIYELINTGGQGNPAWGRDELCGIWSAYRDEYPRFDRMLGEWICDFSFIFHLPPPDPSGFGIPEEAVKGCTLKEYYMSAPGALGGYCNMLLTFCSNYDYRNSKFAKGEASTLYDTHIRGALECVIRRFSDDGLLSGAGLEDSRVIRDAFSGALCSYAVKKKIDVEYCSFSRTHELRFLVTDIIKYSENKIRAHLGIKSRLGIYALPVSMRECIDEYFAASLPKKQRQSEPEPHVYDRLYDLPAAPASPARAAEIEQSSWETTGRLIDAFAGDGEKTAPPGSTGETPSLPIDELIVPGALPVSEGDPPTGAGGTDSEEPGRLPEKLGGLMDFVSLAAARDFAGQRKYAAARGELTDLVADRINLIAVETLGDVILSDEGGGYAFIEDYRKEVFDD